MQTGKILRHQDTLESVASMKKTTATDKTGRFNYSHPKEGNGAHRWRCLKRNMRHDERLDAESAGRLLDACRKIPGIPSHDLSEIEAEFAERFGNQLPQQGGNLSRRARE